jgi:hypothetical protein
MRALKSIIKLGLMASIIGGCAKNPLGSAFTESYKPQFDCGFVQNVYGERISWKNNIPISFHIHQSVPMEYRPVIESAMKKWERVAGRALFKLISQNYPGPDKPRQDGLNVIYWLNTWDSYRGTEQGRTSVYWIGSEIREADIRVNAFNFDFYIDQPKSSRDVHFESLIIHELGHVLGLKHYDDGQSVMGTYLAANTERNNLSSIDISALQCEYQL